MIQLELQTIVLGHCQNKDSTQLLPFRYIEIQPCMVDCNKSYY